MKRVYLIIIGILLFIFLPKFTFSQSQRIICGPLQSSTVGLPLLFITDGFPSAANDALSQTEPKSWSSINVHKDTLYDYSGKAVYCGFVVVTTKDSCDMGLKYILRQTENWIFSHPVAEFNVNGKKVDNDAKRTKKLFQIKPSQINKIKIIEPGRKKRYKNGALLIKTK